MGEELFLLDLQVIQIGTNNSVKAGPGTWFRLNRSAGILDPAGWATRGGVHGFGRLPRLDVLWASCRAFAEGQVWNRQRFGFFAVPSRFGSCALARFGSYGSDFPVRFPGLPVQCLHPEVATW